jgi:hypothetical protein
MALDLYNYIEEGIALDSTIDIRRYQVVKGNSD